MDPPDEDLGGGTFRTRQGYSVLGTAIAHCHCDSATAQWVLCTIQYIHMVCYLILLVLGVAEVRGLGGLSGSLLTRYSIASHAM